MSNGLVHRSVIIVVGGDPPQRDVAALLNPAGFVIAADSGLDHAFALGLEVALVVGDFDSVSAGALDRARAAGIAVESHPADKNATDTEIAVDAALARRARSITFVGGAGSRLDHLLATIALLTHEKLADCRVEGWFGTAHLSVVRGPGRLVMAGTVGATVTLIPIGSNAVGVTTTGLRWPLADEVLMISGTRGVSNEFSGGEASVEVRVGTVLVIRPNAVASA